MRQWLNPFTLQSLWAGSVSHTPEATRADLWHHPAGLPLTSGGGAGRHSVQQSHCQHRSGRPDGSRAAQSPPSSHSSTISDAWLSLYGGRRHPEQRQEQRPPPRGGAAACLHWFRSNFSATETKTAMSLEPWSWKWTYEWCRLNVNFAGLLVQLQEPRTTFKKGLKSGLSVKRGFGKWKCPERSDTFSPVVSLFCYFDHLNDLLWF